MSNFKTITENLSPELYLRFKEAVAIGKWPDGTAVSDEQKALLMDAIIIYENKHLTKEQHTAFMPDQCADKNSGSAIDSSNPLKWQ